MDDRSGGDVVVEVLERAGTEVVFGIPSVHNLPIYEALRHSGQIRVVTVRHEQAAAGAADGYARVTGKLGVCLTSTGPGAANAMGALYEAWTSSSPVLHLTGQIDSRELGRGRGFIHEAPRQSEMLSAVSKWQGRVEKPGELVVMLGEAVRSALTPRQGPSSLEIPIDLQYASHHVEIETTAVLDRPPDPSALDRAATEAVSRAASLIAGAARPVIWAGGGAVMAGAGPAVRDLALRCGAGVLTSPNGRGVLRESDPLCLGNLGWEPAIRGLFAEADLLIAVGTRFQGPNTANWQMALPETIIQIDIDAGVPGRAYLPTVTVLGDARLTLEHLLTLLGESPLRTEAGWTERVVQAGRDARASLRATLGPQAGLLDELERAVTPETVVVKDSTIPAYTWGNRLLPVEIPRTSIMPNGFAIGLGLPHAIGAAAAVGSGRGPGRHFSEAGEAEDHSATAIGSEATASEPRPTAIRGASTPMPVVLLVGDGGFMLAGTELATCAAEGLAVVVVLFDDGGYGILRNIQQRQYGATTGVDLGRPDFCRLAEAFGVHARRVCSIAEYADALAEALARPSSSLISVDLAAIGPMAVPYTGTSRPPKPDTSPA